MRADICGAYAARAALRERAPLLPRRSAHARVQQHVARQLDRAAPGTYLARRGSWASSSTGGASYFLWSTATTWLRPACAAWQRCALKRTLAGGQGDGSITLGARKRTRGGRARALRRSPCAHAVAQVPPRAIIISDVRAACVRDAPLACCAPPPPLVSDRAYRPHDAESWGPVGMSRGRARSGRRRRRRWRRGRCMVIPQSC